MHPEAIRQLIESQLLNFLESKDFNLVSRAISNWNVFINRAGTMIVNVHIVGQEKPLSFVVKVEPSGK